MTDSLFLLSGDGSLRTMTSAPFQSEDVFQALLEKHPALLTTSNFGESEPRRWALVRREMSVRDSADSSGRWSLDHLFLDQDGIPTLVEIKRATDTRARREVVAQMLDYAANAVSWWRVSELVEHFRETAIAQGRSPQEVLADLLDVPEVDEEAFWRKVQANLTSGRIRLLFVADVIHPELQKIVEFLNEQMSPAVVAAIELRPFASGSDRLIAPRIIGETQKARAIKTVANESPLEEPSEWLQAARGRWTPARIAAIEPYLAVMDDVGFRSETSKGGFNSALDFNGRNKWLFTIGVGGLIYINIGNCTRLGRLQRESNRAEFISRFNDVPGLQLSTSNVNGYPAFAPERVSAADGWPEFKSVLEAFCVAVRSKDSSYD